MPWPAVVEVLARSMLRKAVISVVVPVLALALSLVTTHALFAVLRYLRHALLALLYWLAYAVVLLLCAGFFMRLTDLHPDFVDTAYDTLVQTNWTQAVLYYTSSVAGAAAGAAERPNVL
jgi:uncharacterized membrane protein YciS (DUF1049 family)